MPRFLFLLLLLGSSLGMIRSEPLQQARGVALTHIDAKPVSLDPEGRASIGRLRYVGGHVLTSTDPRFGGISSMALVPGGFLAMSDGGTAMWLEGRPPRGVRLRPLPAGPGSGIRKSDRDSEAMTRDAAGRTWVAFEGSNSVWRYDAALRRSDAHRNPPEMARWRGNTGAEAMVRLPDGRFLIWSEGRGAPDGKTALLLFDRDPTDPAARATRLSYRLQPGFAVTDAAATGDGRIIMLHRSATLSLGLTASIGIIDIAALKPGAPVAPRMLAWLRPPMTVDNMEAIAVDRRGGRLHLWIASDDNFSAFFRTMLLHFELVERR